MAKKPTGKLSQHRPYPSSASDSSDLSSRGHLSMKKPPASSISGQKLKGNQPRSLPSPSQSSDSTSGSYSTPSAFGSSIGEDSHDDSGSSPANANTQPQPQEPDIAVGKQLLKTPSTVVSGLNDGEEDDEETDSSSDSEQQPQPSLPQEGANAEAKKATLTSDTSQSSEDESESSFGPDPYTTAPSHGVSSIKTADPSLKTVSSKPIDTPTKPEVKRPINTKRFAATHTEASGKKRKIADTVVSEGGRVKKKKITPSSDKTQKSADIAGAEGGQEKKEITRMFWSKADELTLFRHILIYKQQHQTIPSTQALLEELKSENHSSFASATLTQVNDKIRRMKQKYSNIYKNSKGASIPYLSKIHDDGFGLWSKIWGPEEGEAVLSDDNGKTERRKESTIKDEGKATSFAVKYPFLSWHCKNIHGNNAISLQSYISPAEAKVLESSCKKLEMSEIQLHMQKVKLLPSALKLIDDALAKL